MNKVVDQKVYAFFSQFKQKQYKKGEILIRADDDPSGIFYIEDGLVKEYAISRKGEELVVNIFKPGAFFPMTWGINQTPNRFFFEAVNSVSVRKAPRDEVIAFIKKQSDVLFDLMSRVYKGADGMLMKMFYLMSGSAYTRLVTELLINAKRFGIKDTVTGYITCRITEKDLASETGMTRETVSREIKLLKNKGILDFHTNALVIKDMHLLEEELSDDFNGLS
jgi:CRP/FNR family transcriptional regulator, cyclic AMP receptor protein